MIKVLVSHLLNEEYLLKWWLPHHLTKFDFGVIIDYGSTDNSLDIVRHMAPHWQIIRSANKDFDSYKTDSEVCAVEQEIQYRYPGAWMMALNTTEFLIGDTSILVNMLGGKVQKTIPCDIMVDPQELEFKEPDPNKPLVLQRTHGIPLVWNKRNSIDPFENDINYAAGDAGIPYTNRMMRSIHNYPHSYLKNSIYGVGGRHYWGTPYEWFRVLWYGWSPYTSRLVERKCAIQKTISEYDRNRGAAGQHLGLTEEISYNRLKFHQKYSVDLKQKIYELEGLTL